MRVWFDREKQLNFRRGKVSNVVSGRGGEMAMEWILILNFRLSCPNACRSSNHGDERTHIRCVLGRRVNVPVSYSVHFNERIQVLNALYALFGHKRAAINWRDSCVLSSKSRMKIPHHRVSLCKFTRVLVQFPLYSSLKSGADFILLPGKCLHAWRLRSHQIPPWIILIEFIKYLCCDSMTTTMMTPKGRKKNVCGVVIFVSVKRK